VLWDHDGTLVDSLPVVVAASNEVLRARRLPELPPDEIIHGMALPTAPRMGRHAGIDDPREQARLAQEFYAAAHRHVALATVYHGLSALVGELARRPLAQGLVSNNEGRLVRRILGAHGLAPHFGVIWGEEDVPAPKPDPRGLIAAARALGAAPGEAIYVSDGLTDIKAAHGAGMRIIGVTWGIHPRDEMERAAFDLLVDTPQQLLQALSADCG
jgi:phosphoglycolate phosphatase